MSRSALGKRKSRESASSPALLSENHSVDNTPKKSEPKSMKRTTGTELSNLAFFLLTFDEAEDRPLQRPSKRAKSGKTECTFTSVKDEKMETGPVARPNKRGKLSRVAEHPVFTEERSATPKATTQKCEHVGVNIPTANAIPSRLGKRKRNDSSLPSDEAKNMSNQPFLMSSDSAFSEYRVPVEFDTNEDRSSIERLPVVGFPYAISHRSLAGLAGDEGDVEIEIASLTVCLQQTLFAQSPNLSGGALRDVDLDEYDNPNYS